VILKCCLLWQNSTINYKLLSSVYAKMYMSLALGKLWQRNCVNVLQVSKYQKLIFFYTSVEWKYWKSVWVEKWWFWLASALLTRFFSWTSAVQVGVLSILPAGWWSLSLASCISARNLLCKYQFGQQFSLGFPHPRWLC